MGILKIASIREIRGFVFPSRNAGTLGNFTRELAAEDTEETEDTEDMKTQMLQTMTLRPAFFASSAFSAEMSATTRNLAGICAASEVSMKLPQIRFPKVDDQSLPFLTKLELGAGAVFTALLLRWLM